MYNESLVKPKITGLAYVTGYNQIVLDDHDPFQGRAPCTVKVVLISPIDYRLVFTQNNVSSMELCLKLASLLVIFGLEPRL